MPSALLLPSEPIAVDTGILTKSHVFPYGKLWWNTNVPVQEWTVECPEFLQHQGEKNIHILSTKDEDLQRVNWSDVKSLIDSGRIDQFHRMPSDLRRYLKYCHDLKQQYGSILNFIQHERLQWPTVDASGDAPFANEHDYKILYNDWPYSLESDIIHIVVWTKFNLEEDERTGKLSKDTAVLVEEFVMNTFCQRSRGEAVMNREDLRWFKNWTSLKSVHALEHFHIMLYKPPPGLVQTLTNGDKPMCERF